MDETDSGQAKAEYAGPRSPVRVMQIVETLAEAREPVSLASLAQRLGIPKTSVLNHLRVLVTTGHVMTQGAGYVLGPASLRLGAVITANSAPLSVISTIVRRLAEETGETAICGVLDRNTHEVVYIDVSEGRHSIRYSPPVGARRQLYCSGMGRALLAFQSEHYIRDYLDAAKLERHNANTVTSKPKLKKILEQTRQDRIAITLGESVEDLGAIAAPVVERSGAVQYSVGVAIPVMRFAQNRAGIQRVVLDAAERASWALGG